MTLGIEYLKQNGRQSMHLEKQHIKDNKTKETRVMVIAQKNKKQK